jgi:DNA polymerase III alpha subunit
MKQNKDAQEYFVSIEEPIELRKNILEGSRMLIHALQRYERFKQVRHKKLEAINRLNQITREIGILLTKLRNEMPKVPPKKAKPLKIETGMPKLIVKKGKEQKQAKVVVRQAAPRPVEAPKPLAPKLTEVERLQQELDSIEGQLKHLN